MNNDSNMPKRAEILTAESIGTLFINHPYLMIFQKEDWQDYLQVLASLYDLLEEDRARIPYESLRSLLIKFYSQRKIAAVEQKVSQFLSMAIGELGVLRDSHDQFGQRHMETTREGKELLQLAETLVSQKTRFSGTGAETLLGALNNILANRQQFTEEEAIAHHKAKIKSYQRDLQKITEEGVEFAELLPLPHSNEALFSQAEEAAKHILGAIEDVKEAIENQRKGLADSYFEKSLSAGQSINAMADFYSRLHQTPEYLSYIQAKNLLSFLEGYADRFPNKNVDHLVHDIQQRDLVEADQVQRSTLKGFATQFLRADLLIQEKVKAQLKILQQQVNYALTTNVQALQTQLAEFLSQIFLNKETTLDFVKDHPLTLSFPCDLDSGLLELYPFSLNRAIAGQDLVLDELGAAEEALLFAAMARAEETTLKTILENFQEQIHLKQRILLSEHDFTFGLTEYYVLSELSLFHPEITVETLPEVDLKVSTKSGDYVLRQIPDLAFSIRGVDGT